MRENRMQPLVIYHGNCTDGFTAAWVAQRYVPDAELFAGFYGQAPPDVTDRQLYILDFSYKRPVMEQLCEAASRTVIIDHHKTSNEDLAGLDTNERVRLVFDMEHSGARLAWDWFAGSNKRPWLIDYVEDRDLWRWQLPNSRLVSAGIEAVRKTLREWDALAIREADDLARDGEVIERYRLLCIEAVTNLARPMVIADYKVRAANSSEMRFASDAAHELADGKPFGATYWIRQDGIVQFSLRSRENGVDVSEIAKGFGGGGHKHAAGFQTSVHELTKMLGQ